MCSFFLAIGEFVTSIPKITLYHNNAWYERMSDEALVTELLEMSTFRIGSLLTPVVISMDRFLSRAQHLVFINQYKLNIRDGWRFSQ